MFGSPRCFAEPRFGKNLDREVLQERLLLTSYGLGSNAGIKRMSAGQQRTKL